MGNSTLIKNIKLTGRSLAKASKLVNFIHGSLSLKWTLFSFYDLGTASKENLRYGCGRSYMLKQIYVRVYVFFLFEDKVYLYIFIAIIWCFKDYHLETCF